MGRVCLAFEEDVFDKCLPMLRVTSKLYISSAFACNMAFYVEKSRKNGLSETVDFGDVFLWFLWIKFGMKNCEVEISLYKGDNVLLKSN